jgi:ABC-2 type transport system ATP-binding protein
LLLGLLEPTSGRVEVLGFDPSKQPDEVRARTGALLEYTGIYEQMSAEDNLEFYARIWRLPTAERQVRIKELLTQMGLWERRKELAGKWSKGMKQKLALARAILHQPPLIILDEPTAGLDVMAATSIRKDLASLADSQGVTIFLTTHNMVEAERLCDQVAVIIEGKLVALNDPDDLRVQFGGYRMEIVGSGFNEKTLTLLRARPEVSTAEVAGGQLTIYLGEETDTAPLINLLVDAGVAVKEVRRGKASLEEVFVTLMEEAR